MRIKNCKYKKQGYKKVLKIGLHNFFFKHLYLRCFFCKYLTFFGNNSSYTHLLKLLIKIVYIN